MPALPPEGQTAKEFGESMLTNQVAARLPADPLRTSDPKPRLCRWEASAYLQEKFGISVAPATLARLASVGGGPKFQKQNKAVLYPRDELHAWAVKRLGPLISSTSERSDVLTEHAEPE